MKKAFFYALFFVLTSGALGCSIDLSQTTISTEVAPSSSSVPNLVPNLQTPSITTTTIPITWASLDLTGKLVYTSVAPRTSVPSARIQVLDLATGEISTLFTTPEGGWVYYVTVSPDSSQLVMSYIPPSQGQPAANRALYIMPLDGSTAPQLMFTPPTPDDHYIHVEWSPDREYIYFVHYNHNVRPAFQLDPTYNIHRMKYPDGQPEKIAESAFWPRISSDSTKLVYVSVDPVSAQNDLYVANADGSNSKKITFSGSLIPEVVDAPIFSPDGQSILFSAPPPPQAYQPSWFEKILGIQVAQAHDIPSDWWSVPVTGGEAIRLTHLQTINLFAAISPDNKHIASISGNGIFVMDLEGSNLTQLVLDPAIFGTVRWIP